MENLEQPVEISAQDIVFECPACGKSMVIDEAAVGEVIECLGCHINVIVPERAPAERAQLNEELLSAAQTGDAALLRALLARAADVQARDATGWSPLMRAAHSGNREAVQALLEYGADTASTSQDGVTALKLAEQAGHFHIMRDLWKAAPAVDAYRRCR